jgi:hypothetical protein
MDVNLEEIRGKAALYYEYGSGAMLSVVRCGSNGYSIE